MKEKKKQLDLEAAKLILIKIAEEKKAREECDPTKKILYSTRRSLKGEYLRSVHESMRWKLFGKIHDEKGSRIDLIAVGAEVSIQLETEADLCSESDSSVSELSVALSSNEEVCPKIDTCRRGSRSEQKARDAHRGSLVSRDHSVADFSESSTHRGNGRRRPSVVQDRNKSARCENENMNAYRKTLENAVKDCDIEYEMRRRNETASLPLPLSASSHLLTRHPVLSVLMPNKYSTAI